MPENITAARKRARDFHKDDPLAQTNQIKYDCFFCIAQKAQKYIFSKSENRNKNSGHVLLDFILFFNIAVEKCSKKIIWPS